MFTGLALARAARARNVAMVHMGCSAYSEGWGFYSSAGTLLWHMKSKMPERIVELHAWAQQHHCRLPFVRLECARQPWVSCAGATWRRCYTVYNTANCTNRMFNLHKTNRGGPAPRRECWDWVEQNISRLEIYG